jgi:hypothetical protein
MWIECTKVHYVSTTQIKEHEENYLMSYSGHKTELVWGSYIQKNKGKILAPIYF